MELPPRPRDREADSMFDFDGNGVTDPGEDYLAFRIWEEMCGVEEDDEAEEGTEEDG